MAKRSRGHTSRPGQRPPLQRQAPRPTTPAATAAVVARPAGLTDEEEARAAQLEAAIVAEERQAETASKNARAPRPEPVSRTSSLEVSAAEEYAYVARDIRRIALVGGSLVALLVILWLVSHFVGIGPL
ncbi:MAG: hypothetical protein ACJ77V_00095 [Chloroflexota bacterium]|jgi:hypothetical protein